MMTRISKRRFLKFMIASASVVSASAATAWYSRNWVRKFFYRMPGETATGELRSDTIDTLMAVTDSLLGSRIKRDHYRDFFHWHAANIPGYKSTYEHVEAMLNRISRSKSGCVFARCDAAWQRQHLERLQTLTDSRLEKLWTGLRDRDQLLLERYVVQPVLMLFARTDAWILMGYNNWTGVMRGLERYRHPVLPAQSGGGVRRGGM